MSMVQIIAFILALITSAIITKLSIHAGVMDWPNARSSHHHPKPRSAGLGICAGLGAGLIYTGISASSTDLGLAGLIACAGLFCLLGFIDDLISLDENLKASVFILLCAGLVLAVEPVIWLRVTSAIGFEFPIYAGFAGSVLFVFTVINAVNFMDGSDGMMAAVMIPACIGLGLLGWQLDLPNIALLAMLLAFALVGFAVFNRSPAKVFAGDSGSLCVGAVYAGSALVIASSQLAGALWLAPMFILVFLADALLTLLRRARYGRLKLKAHREHAYQRLIQAGWSHNQVALIYSALTSLLVLSGLASTFAPDGVTALIFIAWVMVLSGLYYGVSRYTEKRAE